MPAESSAPPRLTVVTVTYAERWDAGLSATVESVLAEPRADLIVVCNGIGPASAVRLREIVASSAGRVELIDLAHNRGSAPAFAAGLSAAYRRGTPVLILDDDNPLPPGSLDVLEATTSALGSRAAVPTALACFRAVNPVYRMLRDGVPAERLFAELRPGAFLSTDVFAHGRSGRDPRSVVDTSVGAVRLAELPSSMWGGLYLPDTIAELGILPPTDLVLYADDNVFSARLRAKGCEILLCLDVEIHDTVDWRVSSASPRPRLRLPRVLRTPRAELWRVLYQNRNAAHLSVEQARESFGARVRLGVNVVVRLGLLLAAGLLTLRLRNAVAVSGACLAGLRGRLGETYPLPGGRQASALDPASLRSPNDRS